MTEMLTLVDNAEASNSHVDTSAKEAFLSVAADTAPPLGGDLMDADDQDMVSVALT